MQFSPMTRRIYPTEISKGSRYKAVIADLRRMRDEKREIEELAEKSKSGDAPWWVR